jgi:hypothetical protein
MFCQKDVHSAIKKGKSAVFLLYLTPRSPENEEGGENVKKLSTLRVLNAKAEYRVLALTHKRRQRPEMHGPT